ncbi:MAG TPA: dihydrolipoyl dehydrogenase [Chthoniobacterales bacterium]|jgi:dihydrolipoamide dehydrogenase|nr:dihydrolipoyl dehydrogenase [Chthoniobacterales bacterium]
MDKFDVIIIGSGPGGYVAAIRSAQLGLKTAIIEKDPELGGTCLNVGCIPSKALLASSDHFVFAKKEAAKHGIVLDKVSLDLATMLARKDKVVKTLTGGVRALMKGNKITTFTGLGIITEPGKVRVQPNDGDPTEIAADHIVIATGSVPIDLPSMPFDGVTVVSSTEALCFEKPPEQFLVIGAGAIGLELGSVWSRLGSEVTVLEFLPRIAVGFDLEISNLLQRALTAQGMKFHLETKVGSVRVVNGRAVATATKGGAELNFAADKVLVSVGRRAFAEGVGADKLGLAIDERGRIKVDEQFRTNVKGIYAIGDVIAGPMLAHKAEEEGIACVEFIAGKAGHVNYDVIPGIIYTNPELAGVGLTEDEAKEKGLEVRVGKFPFRANGRALANDDVEGLVKFIADAATDRILGASILSHAASELIAEIVAVMEFGGSSEDLGRTVHAHPTLSEAVKEAALAVEKHAIHIGNR